jgi:hypothetical protein
LPPISAQNCSKQFEDVDISRNAINKKVSSLSGVQLSTLSFIEHTSSSPSGYNLHAWKCSDLVFPRPTRPQTLRSWGFFQKYH